LNIFANIYNFRFLRCKGSDFKPIFSTNGFKKYIILFLRAIFVKSFTFCNKNGHFSLQIIDLIVCTEHPNALHHLILKVLSVCYTLLWFNLGNMIFHDKCVVYMKKALSLPIVNKPYC